MDVVRLQDFKAKFDEELQRIVHVQAASSTPIIEISIGEHINAASNTTTNDIPEAPSTSSVPAPSVVEPASIEATSSQGSSPEDLLKAYKSADDLMQKFYCSICDNSVDNDWCGDVHSTRTEAIAILRKAAKGDIHLTDKILVLFDAQNKLRFQAAKFQAQQRRHFMATIDKLVQERFGVVERVDREWLLVKDCNSVEELEEKLQLDDDPLELEMIRGFEGSWDDFDEYYEDAKKKKLDELYKILAYLKEYDCKMKQQVSNESLCFDAAGVDKASKLVLEELSVTPAVSLKKQVAGVIDRIKNKCKNQVQLREKLCVDKAVQHACFRYCEILKGNQSAGVDVNTAHAVVYRTIVTKFQSLANFKYSKNWKWPACKLLQISKCLDEVREAEKRRKEVIADATTLLKKLKSEEQLKYLKEHFPQYVKEPTGGNGGGPARTSRERPQDEPQAKKAKCILQSPSSPAAATSTPVSMPSAAVPSSSRPTTGVVIDDDDWS